MSTALRRNWPMVIAIAHLVLAALYGVINPPYGANDETGHFGFVNHVVAAKALPDVLSDENRSLLDQSHQPPLYYVLQAVLTGWIDRSDGQTPTPNVFAFDGSNRRGMRLLLRSPGDGVPWRGTLLALHAARLVSAILGAICVYIVARMAQLTFPESPAAAAFATSLAAFNPLAIFVSSMVNDDVMVAVVGTLSAWLLLRITLAGAAPRRREFAILGLSLGLCVLSKNSSYAIIVYAFVALLALAWRRRWPIGATLARGAAVALPFALLAGPFFVSNLLRYGRLIVDRNSANPLLTQPTAVIGEGLSIALRDQWLPQIFVNAFRTYWGAFGWSNVQYPDWVYSLIAAFCFAGVIGLALGLRRASASQRAAVVLLVGFGLAMMVLPLYRAIYFQSSALLAGRYLLPAIGAYACALAFGWSSLLAGPILRPARSGVYAVAGVAFLGLAVATPFALLQPAYLVQVGNSADRSALFTFEDKVQLVALEAGSAYLQDSEGIRQYAHVTATWRALNTSSTQLAFGISALGPGERVLGMVNVFPARGNFPSTNWHAGDTWQENYDILIDVPCAGLPALGRINVAVYEAEVQQAGSAFPTVKAGRGLTAVNSEGRPITPIVGRFRLAEPAPMAVFWQPPLAMFDGIALREARFPTEARAGDTLSVSLTYEMWKGNGIEAKVFAHALDASGGLLAQDDHAPVGGNYPTDFWRPGECVSESFAIVLPRDAPSVVTLVTGFYDTRTFTRFPTGKPNDVVTLGQVRVSPAP
ncbi:MAG: glycosyltransferase family 39 protein [Anaerolineae bacterium]|nr:glycosyltransferase family 39 protein [Anaerolineae bacterium]